MYILECQIYMQINTQKFSKVFVMILEEAMLTKATFITRIQ